MKMTSEPEVIADLRAWVSEYAAPEQRMTLGEDHAQREVRYSTWVGMLAAYDAIVAERDAAVSMLNQWKDKYLAEAAHHDKSRRAWGAQVADMTRRAMQDGSEFGALLSELDTLRAKLDAAVKTIPSDDAERFICLAHPHNNRWEEALCSAKYQLDAAVRELEETRKREALSDAIVDECDSDITKLVQERAELRAERDAAVRERDEARENLRGWMDGSAKAVKQSGNRVHEWLDHLGAAPHADYEVRFASAVARLAACERDSERYRVLREKGMVLSPLFDMNGKEVEPIRVAYEAADEAADYYRAAVAAETQTTPHAGGTDA